MREQKLIEEGEDMKGKMDSRRQGGNQEPPVHAWVCVYVCVGGGGGGVAYIAL